jgi:ABC-type transport system substrate-binding protein
MARWLHPLALVACAASATSVAGPGCGGEPPTLPSPLAASGLPGPRRGGTLRFSINDDVRTLDPAIAYDEFSLYPEHLIFDGLLSYQPTSSGHPLEVGPGLAESWTISKDRRVYTFTLRAATYEDGRPIVAADFANSFERILDPKSNSPAKGFYQIIEGGVERRAGKADHIRGVRVLDDRHLELTLAAPDESFLMVLAMVFIMPVPKAWSDQQGARIRDRPLASGPFRLVEWKQGSRMVLERNPRYWDPKLPYIDRIELDLQVERDVAVLKFLRGEYDTVERLSSDKYVEFARSPEWQPYMRSTPGSTVYGEEMDVTRPPFNDRRVRQALNYALNKEDSLVLYNQRMIISHGPLPPTMPGYDPSMPYYPFDPPKARALLAEAGYPHGFDIDYYGLGDEISKKLALSMQADLAQAGVRVHLHQLTFPAYLSAVGRHELQFAYTAWVMDFPDPWNFLEVKFHTKSIAPVNSNNETGYSNPEVDRLIDAARVEPDRDRRLGLYHQAEQIIHDDCPWVWHYHTKVVEVVQPYVKNYAYHPVWLRDYRETWLDRPGTTQVAP